MSLALGGEGVDRRRVKTKPEVFKKRKQGWGEGGKADHTQFLQGLWGLAETSSPDHRLTWVPLLALLLTDLVALNIWRLEMRLIHTVEIILFQAVGRIT